MSLDPLHQVRKDLRALVAEWLEAGMAAGRGAPRKTWSQLALAERSGVARETIWRILKQKVDAGSDTLAKLSAAMDWPLPEFTSRLEAVTEGEGVERAGEMSEEEERLRRILRDLEHSTRALTSKRPNDLFAAQETRLNQLGIVRSWISVFERSGDPVPAWLRQLQEEVVSGRFR